MTITPAVHARRPRARWLAPVLPVVVLGLSACGSAGVSGSAKPVTSLPSSPASSSPQTSQAGAGTLQAALESWVTQILTEQYTEACLSSAPVLPAGQDAETLCKNPDALASAKSLHEAWAKPGVKLPPEGKVEVSKVAAKGTEVTVPDTAVKVDGRTLRSLELIGATGDTDSFSLTFKMQKHEGAWYVEGFDLKL
ncbi:hypothetical protein VA596_12530 [Amycolatopsis sp., V23-08]|uniref:Lipoprotein n=1 Tax=Amycolatopsis heterodermiae TaxID=3110235 RepID=A0ABU5R3E0_9PSEU|nr:hypothetical protein [Amycolatopsis sp., V23-08]MEA5360365.1 hypothetical protein [Amycolatopsis sp., V23-08]